MDKQEFEGDGVPRVGPFTCVKSDPDDLRVSSEALHVFDSLLVLLNNPKYRALLKSLLVDLLKEE
jgi:hypothetical protein